MQFGWHSHFQDRGGAITRIFDDYLAEIELAEELGFDEIWFTEHHFHPYGMLSSPNLIIATLAARTQRVRIGNMVNVLPLYDPLRLAEEYALLDHLLHGRLNIGIGSGVRPDEFQPYYIPLQESKPRFYEAVEVILKALTEDRFDHDGKFYRYTGAGLYPRSLQQPYPPIAVAAQSPDSVRWCAERGLSIAQQYLDPETTRKSIQAYRQLAAQPVPARLGTPGVRMFRAIYVGETNAQAMADAEAGLYRFFQLFSHLDLTDNPYPTPSPEGWRRFFGTALSWIGPREFPDIDRDNLIICGDPDRVRAKLADLADYSDMDTFVGMFTFGDLTHEQVERSMRLFAQEIMPHFRSASPAALRLASHPQTGLSS